MNKDDIKKALGYCSNTQCPRSEKCPYNAEFDCADILCKDALNLITEQEKEIERLKAENKKVYAVRNDLLKENDELIKTNAELLLLPKQAVKQAKINVLNELKAHLYCVYGTNTAYPYYVYGTNSVPLGNKTAEDIVKNIDELIKEVEK